MSGSYPRFLADDLPAVSAAEARFHVVPFPLERTVSYGGGAGLGPRAILEASAQLEAFDGAGIPGEAGIYCHPPIEGGSEADDVETLLRQAGDLVESAVSRGKLPITLGGEHTVTYGPVRALAEAGRRFGVVQFDAHADLRDRYHDDPLSHASVMRRVHDLGVPSFAIGVRSLSATEHAFRSRAGLRFLDAADLMAGGYPDPLLPDDFPEDLYVTFDLDAFDPSIMPSTGTPEPGGLSWYQALEGLTRALNGRRLIAADVVELAPLPGLHAPDFTAAKLVYRLMGLVGPATPSLRSPKQRPVGS